MAVLPRQRRRFGGPRNRNGPYSPPSPNAHHGGHDGGGLYYGPPAPSSRLFSQQSILLILTGMGIGYLITINMGHATSHGVGLDAIVKNLEQQRAAVSSTTEGASLSSPMNTVQNSHVAALLRGEAGSNNAYYNHRRTSSDSEGALTNREDSRRMEKGKDSPPVVKVKEGHRTFRENEGAEDGLSEAQERFIETQKLISSQSIPTHTNPHVMKTPILSDSKRKKILITGGAGFVGSHLTDKLMMEGPESRTNKSSITGASIGHLLLLAIEGHEVIVLDNFFTGQRKNIEHWMHHPRFSLVVHDVTEPIMLEVDEIYHLACPASPPHYQYNPVKTIKTSTMGTINMLGLAKRVKAKILLTSTSEIYGDPEVNPQPESYWGNVNTIGPRACYDEGKRVAETMMYSYKNQNNVDVRVARIFNTFGPRMHPNDGRVVSNFIIQSLQDKPMTIYGDGSQTRSFQFVSDLVEGLHALMNGGYDQPVNLGNPDEYTVKKFAENIKDMTGSSSDIIFLDATKDDPKQRKPNISTAKRELNWQPKVKVEEGLKKTIAYFSKVLDESGEIIPTGQEATRPKPKVAAEKAVDHELTDEN
ncbi:hypothetical protein ACHAWF_005712 [Thalassiosira exigua]